MLQVILILPCLALLVYGALRREWLLVTIAVIGIAAAIISGGS